MDGDGVDSHMGPAASFGKEKPSADVSHFISSSSDAQQMSIIPLQFRSRGIPMIDLDSTLFMTRPSSFYFRSDGVSLCTAILPARSK